MRELKTIVGELHSPRLVTGAFMEKDGVIRRGELPPKRDAVQAGQAIALLGLCGFGLAFNLALGKIHLFSATWAQMRAVELIREDLLGLTAVIAFAHERLEVPELLEAGAMSRCG